MKIGLLGYYNADEYCDDYLELIIRKTFDDINKRKNGSNADNIEWVKFRGTINMDINGNHIDWDICPLDAVILGGGSILGVDYGISTLKNNIPFYIYGSGFRDTGVLDNLTNTFNRASFIALRGKTCIKKLELLHLDTSKVDVVGDPIFLYDKNSINNENSVSNRNNIGGVFRPYITQDNQIKQIFEYLQSVRNQKVRLFSFAKSQGDDIGGRRIGFDTIDNLNAIETYNEIIKSSFWFGNRLHPFCISLIHGIPTIGLDIEFNKVESVCSSINYDYWIKNKYLSLNIFEDMYIDLINNHEKIDKIVQNNISKIRTDLKLLAEKIFDDIVLNSGNN